MRKIVGRLLTALFYNVGHLLSKSHLTYRGYQKFMHLSLRIQEWSGNERPWRKPTLQEIKDIEVG